MEKKLIMLKVYAANWCPHCQATVNFLEKKKIPFEYMDIEKADAKIVKQVIEVNGGEDWVVPTMQYEDKWRPGKVFNEEVLENDLKELGVF